VTHLRRLDPIADKHSYSQAWLWMMAKPDLYRENIGFHSFQEFCHPKQIEVIDIGIERGDDLLAFASFILRAPKTCQFSLILPPKPEVNTVLSTLGELERQYFEILGFALLYAEWPEGEQYGPAKRLAARFGWNRVGESRFEYTLVDFLRRKQHVEKSA
jgi:hypothetical protein